MTILDRDENFWSNMISKGIIHHLAKFLISWPSFTIILGNFQKLEQDENFLEQDENHV